MDEKVSGIKGGWSHWEMGCQACGKALEKLIGVGWFCQTDGSPRTSSGIWLKRKVKSTVDSVEIDATNSGRKQQILGFGGAFTDAAAYAASLLPPELVSQFL